MVDSPPVSEVVVRRRRPADLPALVEVLWAQQPTSRYPYRQPLPIPVETFLHADDSVPAWTAELDGRPVGQVCWVPAPGGFPEADQMNRACAAAHGCDTDRLAYVSAFFVGEDVRRLGAGRRLLAAAVADIESAGRHPCLEVLPVHPAARALYQATGWRTVSTLRPAWLEPATELRVDVMVLLPGARADEEGVRASGS